jgi:hypothetical protein
MHYQTVAFITPAAAPRWRRWLLYSPLARIVIFCALFAVLAAPTAALMYAFHWSSPGSTLTIGLGQFVLRAAVPVFAYLLLVRWVEHRRPAELARRRLLPDGIAGVLAGLLLFSAIVGLLWLIGSYQVSGINPHAPWLFALLVMGLGAGIGEEILFRGVLFRIVEEGAGTWWALALSALFFGAVHLGNPGATLWAATAIAIEAGLLFGLLYHVTRSLPLCMGVHAAWNFAQGTIYGIPVSGSATQGWLVSSRSGPAWLSGGAFGAEASVIALGVCTLCSLALLAVALRRGSIVPARRRARGSATETTIPTTT